MLKAVFALGLENKPECPEFNFNQLVAVDASQCAVVFRLDILRHSKDMKD